MLVTLSMSPEQHALLGVFLLIQSVVRAQQLKREERENVTTNVAIKNILEKLKSNWAVGTYSIGKYI